MSFFFQLITGFVCNRNGKYLVKKQKDPFGPQSNPEDQSQTKRTANLAKTTNKNHFSQNRRERFSPQDGLTTTAGFETEIKETPK